MNIKTVSQASGAVVRRFLIEYAKQINLPKPSDADKAKVLKHFKKRCAYCDTKLILNSPDAVKGDFDWDHVIPRNKFEGGLNIASNIAPACTTCNRGGKGIKGKGSKHWDVYLKEKNQTKPATYQRLKDRMSRHIASSVKANVTTKQLDDLYKSIGAYAVKKIKALLKETTNAP